jgi:hypothetical protein
MTAKSEALSFTPRYPTLIAFGLLTLWVAVLCFPMLQGQFLGGHYSDQTWTGIPFRDFWAGEFSRTGSIPLWNPFMFGGLPFVGAMHGDIFYPTSFLRLFLRADQTLNAVFAIHLLLAGLFTYVFLRQLGRTWTASVIGGLAYQLSGIVASQVSPGHDGKIAVSALLPLLLTGLLIAIRKRRLEGYGLVALLVGFDLLSPQTQMTQYSLIFAGLFALYLCFGDEQRPDTPKARVTALGLATVAVALGFGLAMIQYIPFIKYSAFSARIAGQQGWEYATSYAMPPANIFDWFSATFTGSSVWGVYWAGAVKLHSEYVGAAVIALALVGLFGPPSRKLALFLGGVFVLFLLVALGPATPFYRLWYAVVPGVKVTRAAGMAFFIPTFVFACFAAFGVERLERREGLKVLYGVLAGAGVLLLLGVSGGWAGLAGSLAGEAYPAVLGIKGMITMGAVIAAVAAAATAGLGIAFIKGRIPAMAFALGLAAVVSVDLFVNARRSFTWSAGAPELYKPDEVVARMQATPMPFRALDLPLQDGSTYPTAFLMYERVPSVLGHHGNEMHNYDELLGGKNQWRNLYSPRLWNLLGTRFIVLPQETNLPGYHIVARTTTPAAEGFSRRVAQSILFEADSIPPYARVLPAAVKLPNDRIVPLLMDPRLDYSRVLLLPDDAPVTPDSVGTLPPPSPSRATVTKWEPGAMTIRLEPAPPAASYLLVSENWYTDWRATVDGAAVTPMRGQGSFLSVALAAGAREVTFTFSRDVYNKGRLLTLLSLALIAAWIVVPPLLRRRRV